MMHERNESRLRGIPGQRPVRFLGFGGFFVDHPSSDPGGDELPTDLVLLLTPASDIHRRVEPAEFILFVAAVVQIVDTHFNRWPSGRVEVDVSCGLLPGGRLLVEVRTRPESDSTASHELVEMIQSLPVPEVQLGPIAFSRRTNFGGAGALLGFGLPFLGHTTDTGESLDDIIMRRGGVIPPRRSIWSMLRGSPGGGSGPRRSIDEQDIVTRLAKEINGPVIACNGRIVLGE